MNIEQVVSYYPESLQAAIRKELCETNVGEIIFKAMSGELNNLSSEPVARLLVPVIKSFNGIAQMAVVNTALVAHDVLDAFPVGELASEVLSHIASFGEPLAIRILEQVLDADCIVVPDPRVMLSVAKYHSCALELVQNTKNYHNEVVLAGCMQWKDIATLEMKSSTFNLAKVSAAHFHPEFADDVAKLMVKHYQESSDETMTNEAYKFSNFFEQVLPQVQDKGILLDLLQQLNYEKHNGFLYFGRIAENDPIGVANLLKTTNLSNTAKDSLKCRIAPLVNGIQTLYDADLLRRDRSDDVALILNHGDATFCKMYFESHTVDTHTLAILGHHFAKFKEKLISCDLTLKNPKLINVFAQCA